MCGLWGALTMSFLDGTERDNTYFLGLMSQMRGEDSTGIIGISKKKNKKLNIQQRKTVQNPAAFLEDADTKSLMNTPMTFALIGHARKATCGGITRENAHPIQEGNIIGTHNGVISNFLPPVIDKDDTDSRELFRRIAKKGIDEAIIDAGSDSQHAIVYVDAKEKTVNFTRNLRRPLFYMWGSDRSCFYWASERWMLMGIKEHDTIRQYTEPAMFTSGQLYTISLGALVLKERKLKEPERRVSVPVVNRIKSYPAYEEIFHDFCPSCRKPEQYCYCQDEKTTLLTAGGALYRGWGGRLFRVSEIAGYLDYGCKMCSKKMSVIMNVMWISPHSAVCSTCLKDRGIYQYISSSFPKLEAGHLLDSKRKH